MGSPAFLAPIICENQHQHRQTLLRTVILWLPMELIGIDFFIFFSQTFSLFPVGKGDVLHQKAL